MYDIDYEIIMDKVCDKYHITIKDGHRKMLILLYQVAVAVTNADNKTFEDFCEVTMLNSYLERKYPTMNLYSRAYSPWAKN